ncbi:MAG: hypothetical protein LBH07_03820 [Treponema sp.]|jgi:hypothetical protein|nr:hypothetical protein [Treponema sp.]
MKKVIFLVIFGIIGWTVFTQNVPIVFKVNSYLISQRQTANLYTKAELIIDDEAQTWEIILYRSNNAKPERIKLEKYEDIGRNIGVFRTVIIQEAAGNTAGNNLFAYMPGFDGNKIRIDLCDNKTENVRRRLIIEF